MTAEIRKQIAALRKMTVRELREQHLALFGEENRSGNRQYLFRRIAWRLQALAEGDLSERARERARELARDADLRLTPVTDMVMSPAPAGLRRESGAFRLDRDQRLPAPGTVLRRVFKGREYLVTVLSNGFGYDGEAYRSLSAIAHVITGCHWNGYHFFGIQKKERK